MMKKLDVSFLVSRRSPLFATFALFAAAAAPLAPGPVTTPATTRPINDIASDLRQNGGQLSRLMAGGVMADPAKRKTAGPNVLPLLRRELTLFHELGAARHDDANLVASEERLESQLYLFGDADTVHRVDGDAGSSDAAKRSAARGIVLNARWLGVGRDEVVQRQLAKELVALDAAQPDSDPLTFITYDCGVSAVSPEVKSQLRDAIRAMRSPSVLLMRGGTARTGDEAAKHLAGLPGQPLTVSATTVDAKPFSTDQYKGKVVLVDFWATWCGPCKAGLPEVKALYGKYHEKGLEIVGVSNDYSADAVRAFTAAQDMPWVELLDAPAAANHQWNPTTLGYGIRGIPTMFLIDRKGVCRSVTARADLASAVPALLAE